MSVQFLKGDCRVVLTGLPDCSVDAVVTDPPYELGFMGKQWDSSGVAYSVALWAEVLRVLKPGGHLLAFGGSRTYHRLACAVEDAGFEIRDQIMWVYGSGFPKSLDVSKAIDKAAPAIDDGHRWQGWGTALKPAHEPIVVARKPLRGTVAANVITYGTGALNIDGCRVTRAVNDPPSGWSETGSKASENRAMSGGNYEHPPKPDNASGRWPANFVHDGSDEVVAYLGDFARFFYCAKASKAERNAGCEEMPLRHYTDANKMGGAGDTMLTGSGNPRDSRKNNFHPTVKPLALMQWLIRLVTPPGGVVLDPFAGSGSTLVAAVMEHKNVIGIEMTEEYWPIIEGRVNHAEKLVGKSLF